MSALLAAASVTFSPGPLLVAIVVCIAVFACYKAGWLDVRLLVTLTVVVCVAYFIFGWRGGG